MRSKPFVITFAILCGVMVLVCLPLALKFWRVFKTRRTFNAAVEHYNSGRYEKALDALDTCVRTMPDRIIVYQLAGYAATKLPTPDYARARGYYESMLTYAKGDDATQANLALGGLYLRKDEDGRRDLDKAIEHLEAALEANEDLPDAHAALGIAYAMKGMASNAEEHLDTAWQGYAGGEGSLGSTARLWQIAYMYQRGELVEASRAYEELVGTAHDVPAGQYQAALALARAFRVNEDGLSTAAREYYLQGANSVPGHVRKDHAFKLETLAAAACERLGKDKQALEHYRQAHGAASDSPLGRRNLAYALYRATERAADEAERAKLLGECLALYGTMLEARQLKGDEQKQVVLALASFAWNAGKKAEAQALIQSIGSSDSALTERMQAAAAIRAKDYHGAVKHLEAALKADPKQSDVAALVARLKSPPEIRNFRVSSLNPYDPQPMISVAYLPRALPEPIPPSNVRLTLDGVPVTPVFAKAECFFVPKEPLRPGDHALEITVTDSLGLTAKGTLTVPIQEDKAPPAIVGITPEADGTTNDRSPVIAFRATDPSGIDPRSLTLVMMRGSTTLRIVDNGRYQVGFKKSKIEKGDLVALGSVRFQLSRELRPGEYTLRAGATDTRGNRAVKTWTFKVQ